MQTTMSLSPAEICDRISLSWAGYVSRSGRGQTLPHAHVYASAWRPCVRRMTLELTQPQSMPPWPADVLARFRRGDDRERDLLADLTRVGRDADPPFKLVSQQERFTLRDRKGRTAIAGKVDARLQFEGTEAAPLEVKAWSPQVVQRIERFADLFDNPWTRPGAYQLLAYLFGAGVPYGFLLLDRSGLPLLLPVVLDAHLDQVEDFLTRAELALDHAAAGTLPDFYTEDSAECRRCPFYGAVCNPPLLAVGATVLTDPDLEAAIVRREQLQAAADEYADLDKDIKKRLRGIEAGIIGPFHIVGKWGKQSRLENLPADLKAQYTVTDPKGRFTLEIARVA